MKNGILYCFSGTGNTWFLAQQYQKYLAEYNIECSLQLLDAHTKIDLTVADFVGIAFPVYAWGSPVLVKDFVTRLPQGEGSKAFVLACMAESAAAAPYRTAKELESKGYAVLSAVGIAMPSNFSFNWGLDVDSPDKIAIKVEKAVSQVKQVVDELVKGTKRIEGSSIFSRMWSGFVHWGFNKYARTGFTKKLTVDEKCVQCGLCVTMCPVDNIALQSNKVTFGANCIACTRCYNLCPHKAIQCGNTANKGRYTGPVGTFEPLSANK